MKQSIGNLTLTDLESLIESVVKKVLKQEKINDSEKFLETFGTWQDEKSEEDIIAQIYSNRNTNGSPDILV